MIKMCPDLCNIARLLAGIMLIMGPLFCMRACCCNLSVMECWCIFGHLNYCHCQHSTPEKRFVCSLVLVLLTSTCLQWEDSRPLRVYSGIECLWLLVAFMLGKNLLYCLLFIPDTFPAYSQELEAIESSWMSCYL